MNTTNYMVGFCIMEKNSVLDQLRHLIFVVAVAQFHEDLDFFFFLRIGQFASNRNYNLPGIVNVACERNSIQPGKRKSRRGHCPAPMRKSQGLKELQPWQSLHLPLSPPLSPAPPSSWLYSQGSLAVLEGKMAPGVVGLHTSSRS